MKTTTLGIACALALAACGENSPPPAPEPPPPASTPAPTAPAPVEPAAPAAEAPAATADTVPGDAKPAAEVSDCSTTIEGNDAMQFNVGSITVPSSCSEFTITLRHTGQLPVNAMGHNVVISRASDRQAIAADGAMGGVEAGYLKADDNRVIAHSDLIGGGQTTSVSFSVSAIQGDGPYEFFCSFPGHWATMRGTLQVG
ncbi:azurin [Luteimonas viscosa]|uniref:Azurin n=2 Tax=Luteimonas viscosa TaxID=1132694 RepID=A0A5D4XSA1_9GAMM|nr:azurin [Luteimonas viscosa]